MLFCCFITDQNQGKVAPCEPIGRGGTDSWDTEIIKSADFLDKLSLPLSRKTTIESMYLTCEAIRYCLVGILGTSRSLASADWLVGLYDLLSSLSHTKNKDGDNAAQHKTLSISISFSDWTGGREYEIACCQRMARCFVCVYAIFFSLTYIVLIGI